MNCQLRTRQKEHGYQAHHPFSTPLQVTQRFSFPGKRLPPRSAGRGKLLPADTHRISARYVTQPRLTAGTRGQRGEEGEPAPASSVHNTVCKEHQRVPLCRSADRHFRNRSLRDFRQPRVLQMKPLLQIFSTARKKTTKCFSALQGHGEKNTPFWDCCLTGERPSNAAGVELRYPIY